MAPTVLLEYTKERNNSKNRSLSIMGKREKPSEGLAPEKRSAGEFEALSKSGHVENMFNIPSEMFRISKMSTPEKRKLESRLRAELEQIRSLQKKLRLSMDETPERQARQPASATTASTAALMRRCEGILTSLMGHKFSWVFNMPVDPVALKIPDYTSVIKHPMDLGTIRDRISKRAYSSPWGFAADVRLTFTNAMTYNPPENNVHIMAEKLSKLFEARWKPIEKKLALADTAPRRDIFVESSDTQLKSQAFPVIQEEVEPKVEPKEEPKVEPKEEPKDLTSLKRELADCLVSMADQIPGNIINFFKTNNEVMNEGEEIEVDFEALSDDKVLELKSLLDSCMQGKQAEQEQMQTEPSGVEIMSDQGVSMSAMHPSDDLCEDDVDIGGDEPPMSSYPSVAIEKDVTPKSSKCSSLRSDSDSDSSSSDSDSSGSESDDECTSPAINVEVTVKTKTDQDTREDTINPFDLNKSLSGSDKDDDDVNHQSVAVERDANKDEEIALRERQVSPEKLYHAALMRNRFADTILKAHEKTLDKDGMCDPQKLQLEKENLEKKQREERARIQAEAEAAKAKVTKLKREQEREAQRLALQKMERTVEINENNLVLKELEMLQSVPTDHERKVEDMSGNSNNLLEKLGLFMKDDDDDDEEKLDE